MYLFIFEDGSIGTRNDINDDDLMASDDGYVDIISISDDVDPVQYYKGKWHGIKEAGK